MHDTIKDTVHKHEHEHTNGVTHSHTHTHEHDHGDEASGGEVTKLKAMLGYMLEHNRAHTYELRELADRLRAIGLEGVADMTKASSDDMEASVKKLDNAVKALGSATKKSKCNK
jgi:hypothetical protein